MGGLGRAKLPDQGWYLLLVAPIQPLGRTALATAEPGRFFQNSVIGHRSLLSFRLARS